MAHILKDIVVNILSIVIVGVLAFCSLELMIQFNFIGLALSIILVGIYIFLLCFFYKKIFSKRLFISFEFITAIFWIAMFIIVNHLSGIGFWDTAFGGFLEFFVCLFAIFISAITFIATTIILFIKKRIQKH